MIADALGLLQSLDLQGFLTMFWHFVLFDLTRYTFGLIGVAISALVDRPYRAGDFAAPVSVMLVGFNEAASLRRCAVSLREQTLKELELIVVDDGSVDDMFEVAIALRKDGLVDKVVSSGIRGGKSSATNLGLEHCSHDLVALVDVDTSFDRGALAELIAPLADPRVGAVSGNLAVRNSDVSLMTRFQALEYLFSISLGRRFTSMLDILSIVSGAFGVFRKEAIVAVGGWEVGPGEDADISDKLRKAGWRIRFAPHAWSMTDVPETLHAFYRQRLRWNRSVIRFRYRKYRHAFNPFRTDFSLSNAAALANILFFQIVLAASFYLYLIWLFGTYGTLAWFILLTVSWLYLMQDVFTFLLAMILFPDREVLPLVPYVFGYGLFASYIQRGIRLLAYVDELIFRRSYRDPYVPSKVRRVTDQF